MSRLSLYRFTFVACAIGYIWIAFQQFLSVRNAESMVGVCMFKLSTGIPCPSCGSTRTVISLLSGNFEEAIYWNPLGLIIFILLILLPVWIVRDVVLKSDSFFKFFTKVESVFKQKKYSIPAILLVLVNWMWNIFKGL